MINNHISFIKNSILYIGVLLLITIISCGDDDGPPPMQEGELLLTFEINSLSNNTNFNPSTARITIVDENQQSIVDQEEFDVSVLNNGFSVESLILDLGSYQITEFLVFDNSGNIILATPTENSILGDLVNQTLPIGFNINSENTTTINLEVIPTAGVSPEDLGYSSISFNIIPTIDILVNVFTNNENNTHLELTDALLTIYGDGDSLFTQSLVSNFNVIKLRTDLSAYQLTATLDNGLSSSVTIEAEDLEQYRENPVQILVTDNLTDGLIAFYPFNGNVDDRSGHSLNGQVIGARLAPDRHGNPSNAYHFDGIDDRIEVINNELFHNQNYTVAAWVNTNSETGGILSLSSFSPTIKNNSGYYLSILNGNLRGLSNVGTSNFASNIHEEQFPLNEWIHVAFSYDGNLLVLFIDGVEVSRVSSSHVVNFSENNPLQIGSYATQNGSTSFSGSLDEVRIYDRALNEREISFLSNQ